MDSNYRTSDFSKFLLNWYNKNSRDLPWRKTSDPYAIWVSEIMLQQTRVETVIPYFNKWIAKYPDIHSLHRASEREILLSWEGLGYYRRALNILKAAGIVVTKYDGRIPGDLESLISLPGIGKYTASAISSIAFGANNIAIDGNMERIISRVFDVDENLNYSSGKRLILECIEKIKPEGSLGDFNQAFMDLGALICTPRNPDCNNCPLKISCIARSVGIQNERPVRKEKKPVPIRSYVCAIVENSGLILISKREVNGFLGGLWEFPNVEFDSANREKELIDYIYVQYGIKIQPRSFEGIFNQIYTHFNQRVYVYRCKLVKKQKLEKNNMVWINMNDIDKYPMGNVFKKITESIHKGMDSIGR